MSKTRRPKRSFTHEFKAGAVRLILEENQTVAKVARDLDLTPSALRDWVRQAQADRGRGPLGALTSSEKEEITKLRREVKVLRMEREILEKSAAFFAREST